MKKLVALLILILVSIHSHSTGRNYFWKNTNDISFDSLMHKAESFSNDEAEFSEMLPLVSQMYKLAKEKGGNKVMMGRAMFWDIWANSRKNESFYFSLIQKASLLMDTVKYDYDFHRLLLIKQAILASRGEYLKSYILANRLATYFNQIGDQVHWAYCMGNISNIFIDLNELDEAVEYAEKASAVFESKGLRGKKLLIRLNLAVIYNRLGERKKACKLLKPVVENLSAETNQGIKILYLISYCNCLQLMKDKEYYIEKAYQAVQNYPDLYYLQTATLNKARLFYQKAELDSAQFYLHKIQTRLGYDTNPNIKEDTYNILSQVFAGLNRYDSAYYYHVLHQECQDSLRKGNILLEVHRIKIRKDIDDYRYQLDQSRLEAKTQKRFLAILSVVSVVIILFSIIIFRLLIKRAAMQKRLREVEGKEYHERIRNEQLIIDSQSRELSSNTILLTKKNLILKNLLQQLTELESNGKLELRTGKTLRHSIEVTLREDDEWEYFKLHFEQVHPDFFLKLKNAFPDLTDNELRLCAYSRLNLSIKQIAQMLLVQPKTIVQARYRMRKKMNLEDNEELLNDYLRDF